MNIQIICVGKLKEKYWTAACDEYKKRLSIYAKLSVTEVAEEKAPEDASESEARLIKEKEAGRILDHLRGDEFVIALAIEGESWSSEQLADRMDKLATYGKSNVVFVIGGSLGLAESVLMRADVKLSFSRMTFPHQMMRVILLEQVYRAFRIMRGHAYHK